MAPVFAGRRHAPTPQPGARRQRAFPSLTRSTSGWIEERNFDIELAETPEGYHARVRVFGFPVLEDTKNVFPNEALAEKGALTLLKSQFAGTPDLEEKP